MWDVLFFTRGGTRRNVRDSCSIRLIRRLLSLDLEFRALAFHVLVIEFLFRLQKSIPRFAVYIDQFIELEVERFCVPILRILKEENDEECRDGRRRIDDELPGCRE